MAFAVPRGALGDSSCPAGVAPAEAEGKPAPKASVLYIVRGFPFHVLRALLCFVGRCCCPGVWGNHANRLRRFSVLSQALSTISVHLHTQGTVNSRELLPLLGATSGEGCAVSPRFGDNDTILA